MAARATGAGPTASTEAAKLAVPTLPAASRTWTVTVLSARSVRVTCSAIWLANCAFSARGSDTLVGDTSVWVAPTLRTMRSMAPPARWSSEAWTDTLTW